MTLYLQDSTGDIKRKIEDIDVRVGFAKTPFYVGKINLLCKDKLHTTSYTKNLSNFSVKFVTAT